MRNLAEIVKMTLKQILQVKWVKSEPSRLFNDEVLFLYSSERLISSSQRPLRDNTQHSQQTNILTPGGIRTHDLSRRAAANLRLRPRYHWERQRRSPFTRFGKYGNEQASEEIQRFEES